MSQTSRDVFYKALVTNRAVQLHPLEDSHESTLEALMALSHAQLRACSTQVPAMREQEAHAGCTVKVSRESGHLC